MKIPPDKVRHCYAELQYQEKHYHLIFGTPCQMLRDKRISWETKGYLSYVVNLDASEIEFSLMSLAELFYFGYLVEVK